MKTLALLFILFSVTIIVTSDVQAQPYYYRSGDPTQTANWGNVPDGTGTPPSNFSQSTEYIIGSGKTADVNSSWFFSGNATLRVVDGGTLKNNSAILINGSCSFCLNDGATYVHNTTINASAFIFGGTEVFGANSNIIIKNWSSANDPLLTGINNSSNGFYFGNLELNWTGGFGDWYQNITSDTIKWCAGDFKIADIGTAVFCANGTNQSRDIYMLIFGSYIQNGGKFALSMAGSSYITSLIISKNFYKTGGSFYSITNNASILRFHGARIGNTDFQTIYCNDSLYHVCIYTANYENQKLRLLSDLHTVVTSSFDPAIGFLGIYSVFDLGKFKVNTNGYVSNLSETYMLIGHPSGVDSNISCSRIDGFFHYVYNGTEPQVTGKTLPAIAANHILYFLDINNPYGVTLSTDLIVKDSIKLISGTLNLADYNLRVDKQNGTAFSGVSDSTYINQTGTGVLKQFVPASKKVSYPIGNNSFTPFSIFLSQGNPDTASVKVYNNFPYASVYDTSRMVKKCWYINKPSGTSNNFVVEFQWKNSSENIGSNFKLDSMMIGINQNLTYAGLTPSNWSPSTNIYNVSNSTTVKTTPSLLNNFTSSFLDLNNRYFILGNDNGVLQQYYFNSGEASDPSNWDDPLAPGGFVHPSDLSRTAVYNVPGNKTAVFNSPVTIANLNTKLRAIGNGVIQANAPVTCFGKFQLYDSATYNHNNNSQLKTTLFAGEELLSPKSNFNILKWSDTTDKVTDGLVNTYYEGASIFFGNLTIDFNNILHPSGIGSWGPQVPDNSYIMILTMGDFNLKQCSGFLFAPGAGGYSTPLIQIKGSLNIGDSVNPVNTGINLSYQTKKSSDSIASTLGIGKDLNIYNGGITSDQPYNKARGRIIFEGSVKHNFYQAPEFFYSMSNLGSELFPSYLTSSDTLILKSNFYNSTNIAFNIPDVFQVNGVLDCGNYNIKSMNVRIGQNGKVLIKNPDGMNWVLSPIQTITQDPNGRIEFCGSTAQLSGTGMPDLKQLTINNPNGVTFNKAVTISDTLNLTEGKVYTDSANFITLLNTTTVNLKDTSTRIVGSAAVKFMTNGNYFLPLSNGGAISLVSFFTQAGDETTFQVDCKNGNPFGQTCLAPITNVHSDMWFRITRTSPGAAMNSAVGFTWVKPLGISNISNLRVAKWDGIQWMNCGQLNSSGDTNSGSLYSDYLSSFSPFTIGSVDNQQLPVELASFTSQVNGNKMNLNWTTTAEQNNSGFEIQRAKIGEDSVPYKKIGYVNGHGNSNSVNTYSFEDRNLISGKYKYRLKQIDFNGNYKYYELAYEVIIGVPGKYSMSQNYPNPFNPTTKINYDLPFDSKVQIKIFDMTGREVADIVNGVQTAGYYTVQFNASFLSSGTYFYNIIAEGGNTKYVTTKKMVLVK